MLYIFLVLLAAIVLESLGCYISVIGLSTNASIIIVCIIVSLDYAKVIITSVLYKEWQHLHILLKSILIPSLVVLVTITSSGTFGYLLNEFSKTSVGQEQQVVVLDLLKKEQEKLELRKQEIDGQITQLPSENVLQRKRLTEVFQEEITRINTRLVELDKEIPAATISGIQSNTKSGNFTNLAKAFDISTQDAAKYIAFLIALFIDPLAIVLLIVANFLIVKRRNAIKEESEKALAKKTEPIPVNVPIQTAPIAQPVNNFVAPVVEQPIVKQEVKATQIEDDNDSEYVADMFPTVEPEKKSEHLEIQDDKIEKVEDIIAELVDPDDKYYNLKQYSPIMDAVNNPEKPYPKSILNKEGKTGGFYDADTENSGYVKEYEAELDDILVEPDTKTV